MGNSRWLVNSSLVLACFLYLVFPEVSYAARKSPVVRPASATDTFVKGTSTLDIDRHWGEVIDVGAQTVKLPVVQKSKFSPARIAGGIKAILKSNPLKIAATAGMVYLIQKLPGASFDSVTGQPIMTPQTPVPVSSSNSPWQVSFNTVQPGYYNSVTAACNGVLPAVNAYLGGGQRVLFVSTTRLTDTQFNCNVQKQAYDNTTKTWMNNGPVTYQVGWSIGVFRYSAVNCTPPATYDASVGSCMQFPPSAPMTDSEIDTLVSKTPELTNAQWEQLGPIMNGEIPATFDGPDGTDFTGPASYQGQPTTTTSTHVNPDGSTSVDLSETVTNYNFSYSPSPLSITTTTTTTTNNYTNGQNTGSTTVTDASPNPVETPTTTPTTDQKIDCEFMPTHCSWLNWTKEEPVMPATTSLPTNEIAKPDGVTVNVSASCPAPIVIDGNGIQGWTNFEISFQVACDFLSAISPIVKGVCMMIAALILVWKP